jgi:hypothetical protein
MKHPPVHWICILWTGGVFVQGREKRAAFFFLEIKIELEERK